MTKENFLAGRRALVTGASRGIGRAIAIALAQRGADVALVARDETKLRETADAIRDIGREAWPFAVDVSHLEQIERLFAEHGDVLGSVDLYVNNAAVTLFRHLIDTSADEFQHLIDTNVMPCLRFVQLVSRNMIGAGRRGDIVVITSINARWTLPSQGAYSSTKAMLESMVVSFANELAPHGIRVNTLEPGAIMTDMNTHFTPQVCENLSKSIPAGRVGMPEDIGDAVAFLASDAARYITGATLTVDGGMMIKR